MRTATVIIGTNRNKPQVLNGTIDLEGLEIEEATKVLLQNLVKSSNYEQVDQHISEDDLISGYKKWNENTSTSPTERLNFSYMEDV